MRTGCSIDRCYSTAGLARPVGRALREAELDAAGRPRLVPAGVAEAFGDRDLLLARRLVRVLGIRATAVAMPGGVAELEATVIAVPAVRCPVPARLAACEVIPNGAAVGVHGRDLGRRGRHGGVR